MNPNNKIKKLLPDTFLIGVAGHIHLIANEKLTNQVEEILTAIQAKHNHVALLCLGAGGADQLVAGIASSLGIMVAGVHLVHYETNDDYLTDFLPNRQWLNAKDNTPGFKKLYVGNGSFEKQLALAGQNINKEKRATELKGIVQSIHAENAKTIASCSDYLIALWDGVDNGKTGGTAETVHIALHQKDFKGQKVVFLKAKKGIFTPGELQGWRKTWRKPKGLLYHVVTPQQKNPFAVGRFPASAAKGVPNAGVYETGISPFPLIPFKGNWRQRTWMKLKIAYHHGLFLHYILPAIFSFATVGLGSFGFKDLRHYEDWKTTLPPHSNLTGTYDWNYHSQDFWPQTNDIFNAINLLTFNSSAGINAENVPLKLSVARWVGLLFVLNAFFIAYLLATSKNSKVQVKIFWWTFWRKRFDILCGLNDKSYALGSDLKRQNRRVVVVDGDPDAGITAEAEKKGILVYKGNSYSAVTLSKIKAANAAKVFLLNDDDVTNIRALQELAQLKADKFNWRFKKTTNTDRYIHVSDNRYKDFICKTNPDTHATSNHVFNVYENIARRLLVKFPVHRFKSDQHAETAGIFIFGFSEMAEQLVLSCLRSGFYTEGRDLKITVLTSDHENKAEAFYKKYPALWYNGELNHTYENPFAQKIRAEIFPEQLITFKELPVSDAAYFSDETLCNAIANKQVVSIYFCLPQSMQSAAYLYALLPKIQYLQGQAFSDVPVCDVQCFCHYNVQDRNEVENMEHIVNAKIPNSLVVFFGSLNEECTEHAIISRSDELLPKLINVWYEHDNLYQSNGARKDANELRKDRCEFWIDRTNQNNYVAGLKKEAAYRWKKLSITKKESNRYAADHLWIKLYLLGYTYQALLKIIADKQKLTTFLSAFTEISGSAYSDSIAAIAKVEHRRWCAEKLLEGFLPAQDFDSTIDIDHAKTVSRWNSKKGDFKDYKAYFQEQKLHIDLLPFDTLFEGKYDNVYFNEKIKDVSLVEAIPYLLFSIR